MKTNMDLHEQLKASNEALEFMVSRRIVEAGLSTNARAITSGVEGDDTPIPIQGVGFTPFENPNIISSDLYLHIDCQMRDDDSTWLFFPDANRPDFSVFGGDSIRMLDQFSKRVVARERTCTFDENHLRVVSGTEISSKAEPESHSFVDKALRRLQYSLPQQFTDAINQVTYESIHEPLPALICPIVVTNAPIYVADTELFPESSLGALHNTSEIEQVANEVPYVVVHRGIDRDFQKHCAEEFSNHLEFESDYLKQLAKTQEEMGAQFNRPPLDLVNELIGAEKHILTTYFSQFVVCSYEYLPMLLDEIKSTVSMAVDGYESTEAA